MKAYPAYKESGVKWLGDIPAHWDMCRIKYLARLKSGEGITAEDISDVGQYAVFGGNGIRGYSSNFTHEGEFVLIGRQGALCGNVNYAKGRFWASEHAVVVLPLKEYKVFWLGELLRIMNLNQYSIAAAQPGLSVERISNLKIPVPPLSEQQAIADFLDRKTRQIDTLIAKKQRQIELLQEQRTALINQAVTKGLNPSAPMKDSGVEWLGDIPGHWEVIRLKHLLKDGLRNGIFKKKDEFGSGTKLINVSDLYQDNYLVNYENLERVQTDDNELGVFGVNPGDIFFVRSSLKLEGVGVSICITETPEPTVFECHVVKASPNKEKIEPLFLIHFLNSYVVRHKLVSSAETVTMTTLRQSKISSLEITVPPHDEQLKIIEFLLNTNKRTYRAINRIVLEIEKLQEYRTALISEAVTGKIDVRA